MLVQAGYIYTESLVLAASVAAWACWREDRRGLAVLFCVLGVFTKLTAVAIAASVFAVALLVHLALNLKVFSSMVKCILRRR